MMGSMNVRFVTFERHDASVWLVINATIQSGNRDKSRPLSERSLETDPAALLLDPPVRLSVDRVRMLSQLPVRARHRSRHIELSGCWIVAEVEVGKSNMPLILFMLFLRELHGDTDGDEGAVTITASGVTDTVGSFTTLRRSPPLMTELGNENSALDLSTTVAFPSFPGKGRTSLCVCLLFFLCIPVGTSRVSLFLKDMTGVGRELRDLK